MRKITVFLLAALLWACAGAASAAEAKPEVVALWIGKKDPLSKWARSYVMGRRPGTSVFVRIAKPDKQIVSVDEKACKLAAFTDDKGTDLAKAPKSRSPFGASWLGLGTDIGDDGKTCLIEIRSQGTPAAGARQLKIRASIVLRCGGEVKTAEARDVALAKGAKIAAGPVPMEISKVSKGRGDAKLEIEIKSSKSFETIKGLTFATGAGKVIKHRKTGSGRSGWGGKYTYTRTYLLYEEVRAVLVKVEYYDKIEKLSVPIDLTTGVGL